MQLGCVNLFQVIRFHTEHSYSCLLFEYLRNTSLVLLFNVFIETLNLVKHRYVIGKCERVDQVTRCP